MKKVFLRTLALFMVVLMCFFVVSCGKTTNEKTENKPSNSETDIGMDDLGDDISFDGTIGSTDLMATQPIALLL